MQKSHFEDRFYNACKETTEQKGNAHLASVAQDAMNVSLAAQAMSHTVDASLNSVASQDKKHCSAFIVL